MLAIANLGSRFFSDHASFAIVCLQSLHSKLLGTAMEKYEKIEKIGEGNFAWLNIAILLFLLASLWKSLKISSFEISDHRFVLSTSSLAQLQIFIFLGIV